MTCLGQKFNIEERGVHHVEVEINEYDGSLEGRFIEEIQGNNMKSIQSE